MKKILTLIIDGLGIREETNGNALKKAKMPNYNSLIENYPNCILSASGITVGLPEGQTGNKLIGYKTLSSGQILKQKSSYVHDFVDNDNMATNYAIKDAVEHVKNYKSRVHIVGLMSDSGISSNIDDTIKLIEFLKKQDIEVVIDFIADGKDSEPKSILKYIEMIEKTGAPIITVCGRYYAMDNEQKWDRTKIYYDLIKNGNGLKVKELRLALKNCYIRNITDEYLPPIIVEPDKNIKDNDVVLWVNYNEVGAKQILTALTNPKLITDFNTQQLINTKFLMFYPVDSKINATVLINEEEDITSSLGNYFSRLGITQARIAAPTSYDYVTYFFNSELNSKLPKCNNYKVELPNIDIDKKDELSIAAVTKQIIKSMEKDTEFILASIDTADEMGHIGDFNKTVQVLEFIDECLGKIIESAELNFYKVIILSTHGNVEDMIDENNKPITTNTINAVPFIITDSRVKLMNGSLTSVAPTILSYMDITIPESMRSSKLLFKD